MAICHDSRFLEFKFGWLSKNENRINLFVLAVIYPAQK